MCVSVCEDRERSRTQFVSPIEMDDGASEENEEIVLGVVFGKTNSGAPFQYVCISAAVGVRVL